MVLYIPSVMTVTVFPVPIRWTVSLLYRMERDSARRTMTTYDPGVDAFGAPVVTVESAYDRLGPSGPSAP